MNLTRTLKAAALATSLLPLPALAQIQLPPQNEIDIGGGWQSNTNFLYGRYNGMPWKGLFPDLGVHLHGGDPWDSNGSFYYDADGDLYGVFNSAGTINRDVNIRAGEQGTWGVSFDYRNIPYYDSNTFTTIWQGGSGPGLIPGVAPGSISNVTNQLSGRLPTTNIFTDRDIFSGSAKYQIGDWLIKGGVTHEHKQGWKQSSLAWLGTPSPIINNGNLTTTALSFFAQPVNYDTDRYDITANYAGERLQALLGYTYSQFNDNLTTWTGVNPFAFTTAAAGGPPANISSSYSLPPSNSAHQFRVQLGYNLTPTTRANLNAQYGLMIQNSPFTATTGNGNAVGIIGPPGAHFDGLIETIFVNGRVSSEPLPGLDLLAKYTLDDRENLSPRNGYPFYVNDSPTRNTGECNSPLANGLCYNLPFSYRNQKGEVEAGYRVFRGTKVTVSAEYDATHRSFTNTTDSRTLGFDAKVSSHFYDGIDGNLSFDHSDRWANNYQGGNAVFSLLNAGAQKDVFGFYDYYLASRRRNEIKGTLDLSMLPGLSATLMAKADYDYYPQSAQGLGLKSNTNISIGPDIYYDFSKSLSVHAYYTWQRLFFNQSSLVTNAGCNGNGTTLTPGPGCNGNGTWTGQTDDTTNTVGFGADWLPLGTDVLKVSVDYTFDSGNISYTLADGGIFAFPSGGATGTSTLLIQPLPAVTSTLNSVALRGEYKLNDNISLVGTYAFQSFSYKDFGQNIGATLFSNAVLPGQPRNTYNIHTVIAQVRVRFGAPAAAAPAVAEKAAPTAAARTYLVFFDWDKADLTDRARQIIADAAQASNRTNTTTIEVDGHADKSGTPQYNQALSLKRAQVVGAELVKDGVSQNIIMISAFGDTRPLVPTAAGVREPQNRRVEIVLK